jgi:hypothetical protein
MGYGPLTTSMLSLVFSRGWRKELGGAGQHCAVFVFVFCGTGAYTFESYTTNTFVCVCVCVCVCEITRVMGFFRIGSQELFAQAGFEP